MIYFRQISILLIIFAVFLSCSREKSVSEPESGTLLGNRAQISLSVSDLTKSLNFYSQLGFVMLDSRNSVEHPWALISDGQIYAMLSQNDFPSPALTYFAGNMEQRVREMENSGIRFDEVIRNDNDEFSSAVLTVPQGIGITLVKFNSAKLPAAATKPNGKLGRFGELSIPVDTLEKSVQFWENLGFRIQYHEEEPYPHTILSDSLVTIGLHQTREFAKPALTYFSENSTEKIETLKQAGFEFIKLIPNEEGEVGNAVLESPSGQYIFIFYGEI